MSLPAGMSLPSRIGCCTTAAHPHTSIADTSNKPTMVCYQVANGNANAQRKARVKHFVLLDRPDDQGRKLKTTFPELGWVPDVDGHPTLPWSVARCV